MFNLVQAFCRLMLRKALLFRAILFIYVCVFFYFALLGIKVL